MEQELITLGILFVFTLIGGILSARFKQPMLMGLLLVGALIGPNMFGIIHDAHFMDMMIEFGAVLILFVLGLEFDIPRLKKLGLKPVILATLNVAVMTFTGFAVALLLGFPVKASLFLGLILSFGSTVIIAKVLENKGLMDREEVPLIIAVLIIDDIIAVSIVTFFSGIEDKSAGLFGSMESFAISIFILILAYMVFVKFFKPALAWILTKYDGEEIRVFAALTIWAGFAYLAFHLKLSPAVGAFMAGSIVTSLPNAKGLQRAIEPYNLIISSFFFIAIGTLINFNVILDNIMLILILVAIVIILKLTVYSVMTYLFANLRGDKMFFLSVATFAVGEFSLLIAKESQKFNIGIDLISIAAAVISISSIIMALTITHSDRIYQPAVERLPWKTRKKIERFADTTKAISQDLDLDNKYTRAFKKNVGKVMIAVGGLLITIIGWRKLSGYLVYSNQTFALYAGYIMVLFTLSVLMFYILYISKKAINSLAEIFENAMNNASFIKSRYIIGKALGGFTLIVLGLLWPFAMFLMDTKPIFIIVSFVMMAVGFWQIHLINKSFNCSSPDTIKGITPFSKKHYTSNSKAINQGWKF